MARLVKADRCGKQNTSSHSGMAIRIRYSAALLICYIAKGPYQSCACSWSRRPEESSICCSQLAHKGETKTLEGAIGRTVGNDLLLQALYFTVEVIVPCQEGIFVLGSRSFPFFPSLGCGFPSCRKISRNLGKFTHFVSTRATGKLTSLERA